MSTPYKRLRAAFAALLLMTSTLFGSSAPAFADAPPADQPSNSISFCHANPADTAANGWNSLTLSPNAIIHSGHTEHDADIIQPFSYTDKRGHVTMFPGLNWDAEGQAIYRNGCITPTVITTSAPTVTQPTCAIPTGVIHFGTPTHFSYSYNSAAETGDVTFASGNYIIVATTDAPAYVLGDYTTSTSYTVTVNSAPTDCAIVADVPVAPEYIEVCDSLDTIQLATTTGVTYTVTWEGSTATITATAQEGYVLPSDATTSWTYTDTGSTCPLPAPIETPNIAVFCGLVNNDTPILPELSENAHYSWGVTYDDTTNTIRITAIPDAQYQFAEGVQTEWVFKDMHTSCAMPPVTVTNTSCTSDASIAVTYDANRYYYALEHNGVTSMLTSGNTPLYSPGTYTVRAYEIIGMGDDQLYLSEQTAFEQTYVIPAPTCDGGQGSVSTTPSVTAIELPHTGPQGFSGLLAGLGIAVTTYGVVYFAQPKRRYE